MVDFNLGSFSFLGLLHFLGHPQGVVLSFFGSFLSLSGLYFWDNPYFGVVFIFGVIFILRFVLIFGVISMVVWNFEVVFNVLP